MLQVGRDASANEQSQDADALSSRLASNVIASAVSEARAEEVRATPTSGHASRPGNTTRDAASATSMVESAVASALKGVATIFTRRGVFTKREDVDAVAQRVSKSALDSALAGGGLPSMAVEQNRANARDNPSLDERASAAEDDIRLLLDEWSSLANEDAPTSGGVMTRRANDQLLEAIAASVAGNVVRDAVIAELQGLLANNTAARPDL